MIDMEALAMEAAAGTPMAQEAYDEIESLRKKVGHKEIMLKGTQAKNAELRKRLEAVEALPEKWREYEDGCWPVSDWNHAADELEAALKGEQE